MARACRVTPAAAAVVVVIAAPSEITRARLNNNNNSYPAAAYPSPPPPPAVLQYIRSVTRVHSTEKLRQVPAGKTSLPIRNNRTSFAVFARAYLLFLFSNISITERFLCFFFFFLRSTRRRTADTWDNIHFSFLPRPLR